MKLTVLILTCTSVAFSFFAALAWGHSSRVQIPPRPGVEGVGALLGGDLIGIDARGRRYDIIATAAQQSLWGGVGARFAAGAVLLQAICVALG